MLNHKAPNSFVLVCLLFFIFSQNVLAGYSNTMTVTQPTAGNSHCEGQFNWAVADDGDNQSYVTITLYLKNADGTFTSVGTPNEVTTTKNTTTRTMTYTMGSLPVNSKSNYKYKAVLYSGAGVSLNTVECEFTAD